MLGEAEALGQNSTARRVIQSFLNGLTDTDFAEAPLAEIGSDLLSAALRTFEKTPLSSTTTNAFGSSYPVSPRR